MSSQAERPPWHPTQKTRLEPVLKVQNTLTKSKDEFIPRDGRTVKWYNCGPTVYSHTHLGHARNYVSQDVIRRIMMDYFNYDVFLVMNITDIEDKIIQSARKKYLFQQFKSQNPSITENLVSKVYEMWTAYFRELLLPIVQEVSPALVAESLDNTWTNLSGKMSSDPVFRSDCMRKAEKFDMHYTQLDACLKAIQLAKQSLTSHESSDSLIEASYDILTYTLDTTLRATVAPQIQSLCQEHATFWEGEFMKDMEALRVRPPDMLTRVTEYVPEVVRFIEVIISKNFAYESEGDVYFDTVSFDGAENKSEKGLSGEELKHWYLKLEPWSKGNMARVNDGEGTLANKKDIKRNTNDFVLWKSSKPGEPAWPSPWGPGRPGWHIECSVMASEVFGENMDIHSGGEDLAFPHHDNELAQAEAFHDCKQWVNYFLHTGHLHIEGLKMSKSLKNFITVKEILEKYTARQLRLAFMSQTWNAKMDFQEGTMKGAVMSWERTFNNFFTTTKALLRQSAMTTNAVDPSKRRHQYTNDARALLKNFLDSKEKFRAALCDSFNTPEALELLLKLVSSTNVYIQSAKSDVSGDLIRDIAVWTTKMLRMFGLGEGPETEEIGWGDSDSAGAVNVNREEQIMPYLQVLSNFRDAVRKLASEKNVSSKDFLVLCDRLRDDDLVPLGVALDDQEDGRALVKLVSPDLPIKARNEKKAALDQKSAKKAANIAAEREKERQKMEKGKQPPTELFKGKDGEQYGSWDENGIPLTMANGEPLTKSAAKNVKKAWDQQSKRHEEYLKWAKNNL